MKRSTNFSHTRKPRSPLTDIAMFLQDIGISNEDIAKKLFQVEIPEPAPALEADTLELEREKES